MDTPLRELMTPGVVALPDSAALRVVFEAMRDHRVHAVLVVDRTSAEPRGWVTSRALLTHAATELGLVDAGHAIDEPVVALGPSATAGEAIERMLASGACRVAVRHDHARLPEGVVTDLDLVALLVRRT
jgi:CBS domain-containing protein